MRDIASPSDSYWSLWRPRSGTAISREELWRSLYFFNYYRLILGLLLAFISVTLADSLSLNKETQPYFFSVSTVYTLLVLLDFAVIQRRKPTFGWQLALQMGADVVFIPVLVYFSGGSASNLGMLLLVSLVAAGLISRGRITWFYAAIASIGMLLEHAYAVLTRDAAIAQFLPVGILCISYFAVAWLAQAMSRYAVDSEKLAFARGVDLSNMAEANRLMIHDMPDGVLVVDERAMVRQANPSAGRLLGYDFSGADMHALERCSPLLAALFAAWRQNKALGHEVLRLPGMNAMVRVKFLPVQRQGFWGAVVVLEDLQREQAQAQQVKLAALGRLTANIAHEVRNPLASISYAAELLKEGGEVDQGRLSQIILDNAARLNRIVQDVMQINRRDRVRAEPITMGAWLSAFVAELVQVEQCSASVIEVSLQEECEVQFDRGHLEQVLWNLCGNALRYCSGKPGSVQLKTGRLENGKMALSIVDDGPGVDEESMQKLFEPFFTTSAKGTGLGLYIARELCEANGAVLAYYRGEQGGSCFQIVFGDGE